MISWLSGFLFNPWMAAGAGAVASPILIHILSRRRYRRVRWAAMDFLLDAHRRNRRRVRLEQLILLALRCLVVLLLALAFARPFMSSGLLSGLVGGSQTEHIIVLDDSFSMSAVSRSTSATGTRPASFDAGRDAVEAIARIVSETASNDAIALYVASRPDEPLLSLPNASDENRVRLTETLAGLSSTQRAGNWEAAMRSVAKQVSGSPARANAVVYAISDFQRSDWGVSRSEGDAAGKGPLVPLAALNDERESIRCVLVNVGQQSAGNIAVTSIGADRRQAVAGVPTRFVVGVANHSTEMLRDVELGVAIEGRRLPPLVIPEIMPEETVREPIEVTFDQDGANHVEVELVGAASSIDSVALDNRRSTSVDVASAIRVLMIDGEPSSDQYRDETFLLKTALRPAGRATSGIDVTVVEEGEIEDSDLSTYHVVVLANVGRVARLANEKLRAYVDAGGGLIVFAGDLVDVAEYNASLYDGGHGLLPLPIVGPAEAPPGADAISIGSWDASHPMLRAFEGAMAELLRQVRIDAYLRVEEPETAGRDASAPAPGIAEAAPGTAVVIARMNDAYQSPLIVEKAIGRGRTIFIATSADQEWNDWASNFSYLPLVMETVQYVARSSSSRRDVVVGEALRCGIDPTIVESSAALRTPEYPTDPEIMLNATIATAGGGAAPAMNVVTFGDTDRAGRYEFRLKRLRGGTIRHSASVNPDASESNLRMATVEELRGATDKLRIEIIDNVATLASAADEGRSEFWWPLMLVVAALLMVEHGLAWRFGTSP